MNKKQKGELILIIKELIKQAKSELKDLKQKTKSIDPEKTIGSLTQVEAINERSIYQDNQRKTEEHLKKLELTLKHIDDHDFGLCQECGEEIPWKRLSAVPYSKLCMLCLQGRNSS